MQVDELLPYLREHQSELVEQVREGKYKPNPVRRVEIPKEGGNAQLGTHQKNHSGQTWLSRYDCPLVRKLKDAPKAWRPSCVPQSHTCW